MSNLFDDHIEPGTWDLSNDAACSAIEQSFGIASQTSFKDAFEIDNTVPPKSTESASAPDFVDTNNSEATSKTPTPPEKMNEFDLACMLAENFDVGIFESTIMIRQDGISKQLTDVVAAQALQSILPREEAARFTLKQCAKAVDRMITLDVVTENVLRVPEKLAVFKNGVFNIVTGQPARLPDDALILSQINANFLTPDEIPHPETFYKFLESCSHGNREIMRRICEFIGYALLPANPLKKFFFLAEAPDSGKSLLAEFISALLDHRVISSIAPDEFGNSFTLAAIVGKMINFAMDVPNGKLSRNAVSKIKTLTGRDPFLVNPKMKTPFEYKNLATIVFGSNHPLTLASSDSALWNRLEIIPFPFSIPRSKQDPKMLEKLLRERDAIVSIVMHSARPVVKNHEFSPCAIADHMKAEWSHTAIPSIEGFVEDSCIISPNLRTGTKELHDHYVAWCSKNNFSPVSVQLFVSKVIESYDLKYARWRENGQQIRGLVGLGLRIT